MNTCGHCKHYFLSRDFDSRCRKTGQETGYLNEKNCFEPINAKAMNEELNTATVTKVCKRCGRELPIEKFGKHHRSADGHQSICRDCMSAEMKRVKAKGKRAGEAPAEPAVPKTVMDLIDYEDDDLFSELKRRGYKGTLTHTVTL